ncbi:MAG: fumarylacetoacetate hydrolase family protein, partial [Cytophagales bacterium]|nr:fumarylacetoacetate hydrolase family protein [Cytophagales bacterium]
RVAIDDSVKLIYGYAVGIDLTRRDLQLAAREQGRPWDWGKAFDLSAPCAPIYSIAEIGELAEGKIWLDVNGERRQESDIKKLIWSVGEVISILSHSMRLKPGDLVYTGTPEGVGKVGVGDRMTGGIDRLGIIEIAVGESE